MEQNTSWIKKLIEKRFKICRLRNKFGNNAEAVYKYMVETARVKYPWVSAYANIQQRCHNPKATRYSSYGAKGIKNKLTVNDLFKAFIRDNAFSLAEPSVDRINSKLDYCPQNIRWVECHSTVKIGLDNVPFTCYTKHMEAREVKKTDGGNKNMDIIMTVFAALTLTGLAGLR